MLASSIMTFVGERRAGKLVASIEAIAGSPGRLVGDFYFRGNSEKARDMGGGAV